MTAKQLNFTNMRTTLRRNLYNKLDDLMKVTGLEDIVSPGDKVAIKLHFGEEGNTSFIRPIFVRRVVEAVKALGGHPFITDTNTLYVGSRTDAVNHLTTAITHGFDYAVVGAPLIIADGLRGSSGVEVDIPGEHYSKVEIAAGIAQADVLIALTHFKGHEISGFGGALKNLGMGCSTRAGKLDMHSGISPKVKAKLCVGCAQCLRWCAHGAIAVKDKKAKIDKELCAGCGECILSCPEHAIMIQWATGPREMQEKMVEFAMGAMKEKEQKSLFISFITQVSPSCDCASNNDTPVVADIGILAGRDPVAMDQCSIDMVNNAQGLVGSALKSGHEPGGDKFGGVHPNADWRIQLDHAEKLGFGSRVYQLTELE
ncbi:MAG: 4Fe-4S ferredoxin [Deltaproteobacteria bacterium]|nr:MAG: 4Fe-4S ferredoxin [Deltaproteobacteria bacterium]